MVSLFVYIEGNFDVFLLAKRYYGFNCHREFRTHSFTVIVRNKKKITSYRYF